MMDSEVAKSLIEFFRLNNMFVQGTTNQLNKQKKVNRNLNFMILGLIGYAIYNECKRKKGRNALKEAKQC